MSFGSKARQEVYAKIISRNGIEVGFERVDGGLLSIGAGSTAWEDAQGFYIVLASSATEGLLMVKPWQSDVYKLMPFFKGENKLLITGVKYDASNTATAAYWIK
jgi:hypothetical protein